MSNPFYAWYLQHNSITAIMDQKHRDLITKNFSSLVDQTRLEFLVSALYEKNVFSDKMIEPYMVSIFEFLYFFKLQNALFFY